MKDKIIKTCLSISCPERFSLCCYSGCTNGKKGEPQFVCIKCRKEFKGGKCNAGQNWEKDTLKEWIDVFDLDLEDSKRVATLIDIIVKKVRKEEVDKFEKRLEEYRNSPEVWKNVGISKWKNEGERKGYFTFLNSTGKL